MIQVTTHDPRKLKEVVAGEIEGKTFVKHVKKNHLVFIFDGYGIQMSVFKQLKISHVKEIKLVRKYMQDTLTASLKTWEEAGVVRDLGSGEQIFLPIDKMERSLLN